MVYRAEFSKAVLNVDATDFVVNGGSGSGVTSALPVQGTGEVVYEITVSGGNLVSFNGPVGLDLAAGQNITDLALVALMGDEPATDETYTLDNLAPQITSVVIDDGTSQRSVVRRITVNFDSDITFDSGAFDLKTIGGDVVAVTTSVAPGTPTNQVVLTFPGTIGGSLADGDYRLAILDTHVRDAAGNDIDGDANGRAGGVRVDDFFRFYGDKNGDRAVDAADDFTFSRTYRQSSTDPLFDVDLDYDNDGRVDAADLFQFRRRFRTRLP